MVYICMKLSEYGLLSFFFNKQLIFMDYNCIKVVRIRSFGCHSFSTHAKYSEKLTFLTPWYPHVRVSIRSKKMLFFSEYLAYELNEWLLYRINLRIQVKCGKKRDQKSFENGHFLRSASILDLFPSYILVHSYPN